ncbi:MAG: SEC59/DGK1/VTE5 family protein [Cyanobacteriota bacterium]|nr:SEC59/DGK1/VTE5 family protein [Cyanobacteriota bacterium]
MSIFTENPQIAFQITLVGAWLGAILIAAEGLNRFTSVTSEVSRKIVHIGSGNVILLAWWLHIPAYLGIAAGVISGAIALISYKLPILPSVNSIGRTSFGTFFYAVTIGTLIAWFWPLHLEQYAALGILIMTWGDGLAAIIGQRFGKHSYEVGGIKKSWEGSLTMCLVSYVICSLILLGVQGNIWQTWIVSLAVALVATGLEAFSKWGIDNLTVPVGSAALCYWLIGVF